jgi:hypothetical protein
MTELDDLLERLTRSRAETQDAIDVLRASRDKVEEGARQLESPKAVLEYIDFFLDLLARTSQDLDRLTADLPEGPRREHVDLLRQLASNAAVEQRRCVIFRDKWINRPLPYEQMRPLLNQISVDTRDQLTAYRQLNAAADVLQSAIGGEPKPEDVDKLDRRALFTRWFGK